MNASDQVTTEQKEAIAERLGRKLLGLPQADIERILKNFFPNAPPMRLRSLAEDFANKRENAMNELSYLFTHEVIQYDLFREFMHITPSGMVIRKFIKEPTTYYIKVQCARTPIKELFDECRDYSCDQCIKERIESWPPFKASIENVVGRRSDVCIKCGKLLTEKDQLEIKEQRVYYVCSGCGHKGWNKI